MKINTNKYCFEKIHKMINKYYSLSTHYNLNSHLIYVQIFRKIIIVIGDKDLICLILQSNINQ